MMTFAKFALAAGANSTLSSPEPKVTLETKEILAEVEIPYFELEDVTIPFNKPKDSLGVHVPAVDAAIAFQPVSFPAVNSYASAGGAPQGLSAVVEQLGELKTSFNHLTQITKEIAGALAADPETMKAKTVYSLLEQLKDHGVFLTSINQNTNFSGGGGYVEFDLQLSVIVDPSYGTGAANGIMDFIISQGPGFKKHKPKPSFSLGKLSVLGDL